MFDCAAIDVSATSLTGVGLTSHAVSPVFSKPRDHAPYFEAVTAALRQRQKYAIEAMASSSYFDEQEPSEPFHCTICMTELPRWPADACILQPCGHHFHLECATRWMDRESSCPNCKSAVATIAKSGRSKRRRSEIAVEPKRQSVARAEDMELPDAETQLEAPPSEGYQRDGFVVGDDDVEFY